MSFIRNLKREISQRRASESYKSSSEYSCLFFTYDELMNEERLQDLSVYPERSTPAWVNGFVLKPNVPDEDVRGVGRLGIEKDDLKKVWGVVHEISAKELPLIDRYARTSGGEYIRRKVNVIDHEGYERRAWIYLPKNPRAGLRVDDNQAQHAAKAARKEGLPDYYVAMITSLMSKM